MNQPADTVRTSARVDLVLISEMVEKGTRVLDVGCGDGALLRLLTDERRVDARGIELSQHGVNQCVAQGLSVIQGDADRDLVNYPDDAFDYVILSRTIQATLRPRDVLEQLLRIGRRAIVSFPNFGHWRVRLDLTLHGRMPVTDYLPEKWYESPNIHFCTIRDFTDLCADLNAVVERQIALNAQGRQMSLQSLALANLFGEQAVFVLHR